MTFHPRSLFVFCYPDNLNSSSGTLKLTVEEIFHFILIKNPCRGGMAKGSGIVHLLEIMSLGF